MRNIFLILIVILTAKFNSNSQSVVKGYIYYQSSNNKPAVGVRINATGSNGDYSRNNGEFTLYFPKLKPGDIVYPSIGDVHSEITDETGKILEIVNDNEFEIVTIPTNPLINAIKVIVCVKGQRDKSFKEYYKLFKIESEESLKQKLNKTKVALEILKTDSYSDSVSITKLKAELNDLVEESKLIEENANFLANKYSRINLDDVSELYVQALDQIKIHHWDSAMAILNKSNLKYQISNIIEEEKRLNDLMSEFKERDFLVKNRKQSLIKSLYLKADIFRAKLNWDSTESIFNSIIQIDSHNYSNLSQYANFLFDQNKIHKSIDYYNKCLQLELDNYTKCNVHRKLGLAYSYIHSTNLSIEHYNLSLKFILNIENQNKSEIDNLIASIYGGMGVAYYRADKLSDAEIMYFKSVDLFNNTVDLNNDSYRRNYSLSLTNLGVLFAKQNNVEKAEHFFLMALQNYEILDKINTKLYSKDLAYSLSQIALFYQGIRKINESKIMYDRSISILAQLSKDNPHQFESDLASVYNNYGVFYWNLKDLDSAVVMYKNALLIYEKLIINNPTLLSAPLARVYRNLAACYASTQKMEEAEMLFLKSKELFEDLSNTYPDIFNSELATIYSSLGYFYQNIRKTQEAKEMHLNSIEIYQGLVIKNPDQYEPQLASSILNFGIFYFNTRNLPEATEQYLQALKIYEKLVAINSDLFSPMLAKTSASLGAAYASMNKMVDAEQMFLKALSLYQRLTINNSRQFQVELARITGNLGYFYQSNHQKSKADSLYQISINTYAQLVASSPVQYEAEFATNLYNFGTFHLGNKNYIQADLIFNQALGIIEKLTAKFPQQYLPNLGNLYLGLGEVNASLKIMDKAELNFSKSLEIYSKLYAENSAQFGYNLAHCYLSVAGFYSEMNYTIQSDSLYSLALKEFINLYNIDTLQYNKDLASCYKLFGKFKLKNNELDVSKTFLLNSLDLYKQDLLISKYPNNTDFYETFNYIASIRNKYLSSKKFQLASSLQENLVNSLYNLKNIDNFYQTLLAFELDTLSWTLILSYNPLKAENSSKEAINLLPTENSFKINLAHSLLCQNQLFKAKSFYNKVILNNTNSNLNKYDKVINDLSILKENHFINKKYFINLLKYFDKVKTKSLV